MLERLSSNTKKNSLSLIKILSFFFIIYLFFKFVNQEDFFYILSKISLKYIFLIYIIYMCLPVAHAIRWFIIVKSFSSIKFYDLFKNIITGYSLSLIVSSAFAIDAAKFMKIKKEIGYKNSLLLVSIDKFIALAFKLIFLSIFISFYVYFYMKVNLIYISLSIFFSLTIILIFLKIDKIIIFFTNIFFKDKVETLSLFFKKIKKNILKIIFINTVTQLVNVILYFLIFLSFGSYLGFTSLLVFTPLVELFGQFSFLIFGMKEISTVFILDFFSIGKELALSVAIIHLFMEYLVIISINIILKLIKK
jgi:hypothetical protein